MKSLPLGEISEFGFFLDISVVEMWELQLCNCDSIFPSIFVIKPNDNRLRRMDENRKNRDAM